MRDRILTVVGFLLAVLVAVTVAWAQGGPPPPCEQSWNTEMWEAGGLKQQLAAARERLRTMTLELAAAKAALPAPKADEKQ